MHDSFPSQNTRQFIWSMHLIKCTLTSTQHYIQTHTLSVMILGLKSPEELHFNRHQFPLNPSDPAVHENTHQETTPRCSSHRKPLC